MALSLQDILQ